MAQFKGISSMWEQYTESFFLFFYLSLIWIFQFVVLPYLVPTFVRPPQILSRFAPDPPLPVIPEIKHNIRRRISGVFHTGLWIFSRWIYTPLMGASRHQNFAQLPLGYVLKWSKKTHLDEVIAMHIAKNAYLPVPEVVDYGEHDNGTISILMTRVPGTQLQEEYDNLSDAAKERVEQQLREYLHIMRRWKSPFGKQICSLSGQEARSYRLPYHKVKACKHIAEFHAYIRKGIPDEPTRTWSEDLWERSKDMVKEFHKSPRHQVKFTHGDLDPANILIDENGFITGIVDWEMAGWYPDYWEYGTALMPQSPAKPRWWIDMIKEVAGDRLSQSVDADYIVMALTKQKWAFSIDLEEE